MKTVWSFHWSTNINVIWDKGRIRRFMGVWELENQIKFSVKYSVNSLINAAIEQPKHPQKCIRIGVLFAWNPFSAGGLRPPGPPTRAMPWTHWEPRRPPDPLPVVLPHCSGPSYAPAHEIKVTWNLSVLHATWQPCHGQIGFFLTDSRSKTYHLKFKSSKCYKFNQFESRLWFFFQFSNFHHCHVLDL